MPVPVPMMVANVISIIPAEHPFIRLGIGLPNLINLLEARQLDHRLRALSITGAIEHREIFEHARVVEDRRKRSGVGVRSLWRRIGQKRVQRSILGQAVAELLQIEHASSLVHPLSRAVDGGQECQRARDEDRGGDREIGPTKGQAVRRLLQKAHRAPTIRRNKRQCPSGQFRRILEV